MTNLTPVEKPFRPFLDVNGQPLDAGYIYVGEQGFNPQTNPKAVYWDAALTIPAAQPIRTAGGYPVGPSGAPANIFVDGPYSIRIANKRGTTCFLVLNSLDFDPLISAANVSFIQAGVGAIIRTAQDKMRDEVNAKDFGLSESATPAQNLAAINNAIAYCYVNARRLYIPAGRYFIAGPIQIPDAWSGIYIQGETQGSASIRQCPGTQLMFPGTDGFRVPWKTAINEQFQISRVHFANSIGVLNFDNQTANYTIGETITGATSGATAVIASMTDAGTTGTLGLSSLIGEFLDNEIVTGSLGGSAQANGISQYDAFAQPCAVKFTVDAGRVPPNYNYPQMIYFDELSVTGFARMWLAERAAGYSDPASFFGTTVVSRIHLYRTKYSLHNKGCYFNLIHFDTMRNHVGGTVYNEGAGGFYHFRDCHWEAAEARILISPFSLESEFHMMDCGGEFNGTGTTFTSTAGTLTVGGPDGYIKLQPGVHTRTYKLILSGQNKVPGTFEFPPEFGRFIEIWNYGNPIEILPQGCIIHTPETIKVTPLPWVSSTQPAPICTFKVPWEVYNGAGTNRTPCTQAIAGKPAGTAGGVAVAVTGQYPWIEGVIDEPNFFGENIPRAPGVSGTDQMFVLSYVAQMESGVAKMSSPADITISGTNTLWFDESMIAETGIYCQVAMIRCDSSATLDEVFVDPVDVDARSVCYGSWEAVTDAPVDQPLAVPRYTFGVTALGLLHPAGNTVPMCISVPGSATTTVNVRTSASVSAASRVVLSTATGAYGDFRGGGVTGAAATKDQASIANIVTGTSITLAAVDGDDPDMMAVTIANASGTATTANIKVTVGA